MSSEDRLLKLENEVKRLRDAIAVAIRNHDNGRDEEFIWDFLRSTLERIEVSPKP